MQEEEKADITAILPKKEDMTAGKNADPVAMPATADEGKKNKLDKLPAETAAEASDSSQPEQPKHRHLDIWEEESKSWREKPWMLSPQGRMAIRIFSRGIVGSLFYTIGGIIADQALAKYDPSKPISSNVRYKRYNKFYHIGVRGIAKIVDTIAGKPIEKIFGSNAVTFRDTRRFGKKYGRSLGHELVDVTFNFACASFGDGMGRNIASLLDPNVETRWIKNGKIDLLELGKSMASSSWRLLTYNAGEDWAVSLPYVYLMKGQRALINKFSPGWKYDFDYAMNGGSYKTKNGKIITNDDGTFSLAKSGYFWESALDLQSRLTLYNVGTLMYREVYQNIAARLSRWKNSGFTISPFASDPRFSGITNRIKQFVRYTINSVIRGVLMMTPTAPFFWISRIPQSKFRGLAIDKDTNRPLEYSSKVIVDPAKDNTFVKANGYNKMKVSVRDTNVPVYRRENDNSLTRLNNSPFWRTDDKYGDHRFIPTPKGGKHAFVNMLGRWSNKLASLLVDQIEEPRVGFSNRRSKVMREFAKTHVHSAMSYTPYFMAKTEFAELWGTTAIKRSIDRILDGIEHFDKKEFKAGIKDFWHAFWRRGDVGEVGYGSAFANLNSAISPKYDLTRSPEHTSSFTSRSSYGEKGSVTGGMVTHSRSPAAKTYTDGNRNNWSGRITDRKEETTVETHIVPA